MEWWIVLILILSSLMLLMVTRIPIAFCFLMVELVTVILLWGITGPEQLILSMRESVANFAVVPLALFVLMGTALFHSGIAPVMIDALEKWFGRVPGRLSLIAVVAGVILATLTGASQASTAILGSSLLPEMEKRGYKPPMSVGPIMAGGILAPLIPPSALAVFIGIIGEIDIGQILIAIIIPGLLMGFLYGAYFVIKARLQPDLAPVYEVPPIPVAQKIVSTIRYVLPMGIIVFLVTGVIFLGIATPSEAAATGALGTFLLAACYRKLNWEVVKNSVIDSLDTIGMMLVIIVGANAFSEILAFTEATTGFVKVVLGLPVPPIVVYIFMQIIVIMLGCFLNPGTIAMLVLPLFMPIIRSLGFSDVAFAVVLLINLELAQVSPPIGMSLFIMKGVSNYDMGEVYRAALPVCFLSLFGIALNIAFPSMSLWLPKLMH